jgi:hypothetical protein
VDEWEDASGMKATGEGTKIDADEG